jgi:hypothetical protein
MNINAQFKNAIAKKHLMELEEREKWVQQKIYFQV